MEKLLYCDNAYESLDKMFKSGRFPHALLIEGAQGSGKKQIAKYAASLLLCRGENPPCNKCIACKKVENDTHPDLVILNGSEKKAFAIDKIRELRTDGWRAPNESERRVFLLTDVQNMLPASQNALLKIIEEPPKHLHFIFTASSRGALLDTILSRTMLMTQPELSYEERLAVLKQKRPDIGENELSSAAMSFSTVGQAMLALGEESTKKRLLAAADLYEATVSRDRYKAIKTLTAFEKDREGLLSVLGVFRTLCIDKLTSGEAGFSALQCSEIVDIIERAELRVRQNVGMAILSAVLAGELIDTLSPARSANRL